jgi:hypothetical protein
MGQGNMDTVRAGLFQGASRGSENFDYGAAVVPVHHYNILEYDPLEPGTQSLAEGFFRGKPGREGQRRSRTLVQGGQKLIRVEIAFKEARYFLPPFQPVYMHYIDSNTDDHFSLT